MDDRELREFSERVHRVDESSRELVRVMTEDRSLLFTKGRERFHMSLGVDGVLSVSDSEKSVRLDFAEAVRALLLLPGLPAPRTPEEDDGA